MLSCGGTRFSPYILLEPGSDQPHQQRLRQNDETLFPYQGEATGVGTHTLLKPVQSYYLVGDVPAPGSSASRKVSVVSSRQVLSPILQSTVIVFLAITSASRIGVQPPIS